MRISHHPDEAGRPLDVVRVEAWTVECIIGVYPDERETPQPLQVDLALHLDTREAARDRLEASIDYARLAGEVRFLLERGRFRLLETAADALARYLLAPPTADVPRARPMAIDLCLKKPVALGGHGQPSVQITRRAEEFAYGREDKPFGRVDVLFELPDCGIYRLRIAPGRTLPSHIHQRMEESELILGDALLLQGQPVSAGMAFSWPQGHVHRYDNPASIEQTVLCIDRPAFLPDDEIEVPEPTSGWPPLEGQRYFREP